MNKYTGKTFQFPSPAKLNLFLHVVGQRKDGYHELETLFQFLNYSDNIEISVTEGTEITLLTPIEGVKNDDNLIVKAARLLQEKICLINTNPLVVMGAQIRVNKILPMGGGLGGGSSNAATILVALNLLWQSDFSTEKLAELGLSLGADVPIFIHGFSAFAQGVGEQLTPATPKEYWYLVSKPQISIATASVFSSPDLPRDTPQLTSDNFNQYYRDEYLFDNHKYHNDCQTMVIKHYDEVANLLAWLVEYAPSRMTGTGACVFSRFSSEKEAIELQKKLPNGIYSFVAQGQNKSPLISVVKIIENRQNESNNWLN
ncbi:4-(cytidine 5'-diphospho)-2-C-methyl-D-erythritol kinase [Colwellia sp. MSW7]|jgi:4-diphosphocytidyl-2-C-methyl-D-erythritol kinase|uniref:4-diphosphocytidyl-2-C-methyl-D-erythritol kinase n=1 Tax=Colwellia maritima TaxID=2912588 RepID=A0ABS9X4S6_9GAMM|nr:4-(cytidine 5'-diphospho)-2-C-methyl-D-erythritol kinase [Colwellia maritima]MCI2284042.1 4-(cytidine 5'-diphospho)-2-C-methyl-D-erythritol kinase [Colwellia maritima]